MKAHQLFVRGILVGMADLVPGVSGGTMALLTGIYSRLLAGLAQLQPALLLLLKLRISEAFKSIDFAFFVPLGLGILISITGLSQVIAWLLDNTRDWLLMFFFGMVIATTLTLIQKTALYNWRTLALFIIGLALSLALQNLPELNGEPSLLIFFLSGLMAICAALLPGISGSLLLLLIGMYRPVIHSISNLELASLGIFALGAISGLLLFSRLLFFVYHKHQAMTLALLAGLTLGSAQALWPQQQTETNLLITQTAIHYGLLIALLPCGLLSGWYLSHVDKKSSR